MIFYLNKKPKLGIVITENPEFNVKYHLSNFCKRWKTVIIAVGAFLLLLLLFLITTIVFSIKINNLKLENLNNSESIKSLIFGNENYLALDKPMSFKDGQEACKRISGQIAKLEGKYLGSRYF